MVAPATPQQALRIWSDSTVIELAYRELRPGQTLARSVYRPTGEVLLTMGFPLTAEVIEKLSDVGQSRFWVQEEGLEHIIPDEILPDFLLSQAAEELRQNAEYFRRKAKISEKLENDEIDSSRFTDSLLSNRLVKVARTLVKEFKKNKPPYLLQFTTTRTHANYPFQHSADAAVVSMALGRAFQFDETELEHLALGTMLMDIGAQVLPPNLANKSERLTFSEFNALKEHPAIGFEILRNDTVIPLICAHIAYQHHERQDGGGYPRRLMGTNKPPMKADSKDKRSIHRFAEIVSVADEYMSLIQPRPFLPQKSPLDAIKFLLKAAGTQLNSAIVDVLIPMIPIYSIGTRVQVVAAHKESLVGCTAVISKTNPERQDRPEITLIYDAQGTWIEHTVYNLEERPELVVQQVSG